MVDDSSDFCKAKFHSSLHQKTLFPTKSIAAFETETAVSADEMKRWHDKEWLSFDPFALDEFDEQQWIEVEFVKGLVRSGLSDEWIGKILSKLEKPYCYDPKNTFYSFVDQSWKTMSRIPEPEEVIEESLDSYLQGLADAEDRERLLEIRGTIDDLLENHTESVQMAMVAGVDGCKTGWLCVAKDLDTGLITSAVFSNAQLLLQQEQEPSIIAVDIPIGLTEVGARQCDVAARKLLGPRASSVFPAPIRPALQSKTRQHADEIRRKIEGKGVSAQSFAIFKKVLEFDKILSTRPHLQDRVKEIHPEVCFWAWNNKRAMSYNKKSSGGRAERHELVVKHFGVEVVEETRAKYLVKCVSHDDIYDAFAALWTAERIFASKAGVIPDPSPRDAIGLRMEMWY